jgi:hypothetical protein
MPCDVDPDQGSAVELDNDQGVEQVKADRRNDEQIHRSNVSGMIAQKGTPSLARRAAPSDHIFGDA